MQDLDKNITDIHHLRTKIRDTIRCCFYMLELFISKSASNQSTYAGWLSGSAQYSAQLNYMQAAAGYANSGESFG